MGAPPGGQRIFIILGDEERRGQVGEAWQGAQPRDPGPELQGPAALGGQHQLVPRFELEARQGFRGRERHPVPLGPSIPEGPHQGFRRQQGPPDATPEQAPSGVEGGQGRVHGVAPAPHGVGCDRLPVGADIHVSLPLLEWSHKGRDRPGPGLSSRSPQPSPGAVPVARWPDPRAGPGPD